MFYLLFSQATNLIEIPIYFSDETPQGLIDKFSGFNNKILVVDPEKVPFPNIIQFSGLLFIDITMKSHLLPVFDEISSNLVGNYLTLTHRDYPNLVKNKIYSLSSMDEEASALEKLVDWLGLKEIVLMFSTDPLNIKFSDIVHEKLGKRVVKHISYNDDLDFGYGQIFVQKELKSFGINSLIIIDHGTSLETIQKSIISKRINDTGSLFIFPSYAIGSVLIEGSLILSQDSLETSKNYNEYCFMSILNYLKSQSLLNHDQNLASLQVPPSNVIFSLLNIKNGIQSKVASISSNISQSDPIIFPGNVNSLTSLNTKALIFLIANGTNEVLNYNTYFPFSYYYNGAIFAVNEVNSKEIIPRFKLNLRTTDTGLFYYQEDWYKFKLSQVLIKPFPVLYLTSYWSTSAIGNSLALKSLNIKIPQISPFAQSAIIESKENFPDLVKISVSEEEYITNGLNFIMSLGWKSLVLFGTDDDSFYRVYLAAARLCKARGIKIVNPEEFRVLPANYSGNDFEKFRMFFQAAKDTRCRVYLVVTFNKAAVWEGLYDVGLRKGDFLLLGILERLIIWQKVKIE
jgi:hypothetical protein